MIFENLITENKADFVIKVIKIANNPKISVPAEHLMFVMWFETAHTLNSHIQNSIKATGLIQFMPATAIGLGTTVDDLKAMSNVDQLDYVEKHLAMYGPYKDYVDLYCAIFWPAAAHKDDSYLIGNSRVAAQNPIFDLDKNGQITKAEVRAALKLQVPKDYATYFS